MVNSYIYLKLKNVGARTVTSGKLSFLYTDFVMVKAKPIFIRFNP